MATSLSLRHSSVVLDGSYRSLSDSSNSNRKTECSTYRSNTTTGLLSS